MFDPVDPKQRLPDVEEGILQYWKEEDTFKRSVKRRHSGSGDILDSGKIDNGKLKIDNFSFYDGPPFATGLPHYGHILAGTIKDVIPRYQTMRGKHVERRFGWDCHGLPIENLIEQEHNITNKQQIEEKGVGWFNDLCRGSVQRYTGEWREVVERMGRWVDMDWDYRTMDAEFMESMWWAFAKLHDKGFIYEGHKPMHICPRCVTPLSNFEVTQGYKDVDDMSVMWKFLLEGTDGIEGKEGENVYVLAWTTTPWSTLSTMGLSINPKADYVKVKVGDEHIIFAKARLDDVMKGTDDYEVVDEFKGKTLVGKQYQHIVDWYSEQPEVAENKNVYHIFAGDYVEETDGTGLVTINGSYGEIDMEAAKKNKLPFVMDVDMTGLFNEKAGPYAGMEVKEGQKKIIQDAKEKGLVWKSESFRHSYPHCWRCDSPLLNYATSSWFVKVEAVKKRMLDEKAKTEWMPAHIRDGRYGNWLENARDWAISRNRYWGTPLPIWRSSSSSDRQGDMDVIGSRDDLMKKCQIRFTKITALRHGESEGNLIPIYQGQEPGTDLTKNGKAQAKATADWLKDEVVDVIYCSPLARTRQTAEVLAEQLGAELIVDDRLREVSFGEYEGKTVDFTDLSFLKARRAHKLESGTPESIYHFEGMETWGEVALRIESFMKEILPKHRSEHIVVVTHADPLQNIRSYFTGEDPFKLSHQPYPTYAYPYTFFWDHKRQAAMDLHKDNVDDIVWSGSEADDAAEVTLVRHGESEWNVSGICQGNTKEVALTEKGREQALALAKKLKAKDYDVIISSDLDRAIQTAEILAKELGLPYEEKWPELQERHLGEYMGKTFDEILPKMHATAKNAKLAYSELKPEGGETLDDFLARAQSVSKKLHERFAGKRVLVVTHGGLIGAISTHLQNQSATEMRAQKIENTAAIPVKISAPMVRIPEVLDCWFESGSMPYAQQHYPFELGDEKRKVPKNFPADFIAEGLDQTRAWFYTLMVLSVALFDETPFKNVIVNGIVLAEDGKKMSKRLKNYPDPMEVVHKHGADAVRFTLMSSPAVRAEDLRFSEKLVEETVRGVLLPLWNTYSFFVTYANAANFEPVETRTHSTHPLDTWIRAEVQDLVNRMTEQLDKYDLSATCAELHETIDALTNWYIRLSRRRFAGKGTMDEFVDAHGDAEAEDQHAALHTLYDVLLTLAQALAPFCPYITEAIYLNLAPEDHASIHFTDWPATRKLKDSEQMLIDKTRLMRLVVSLGNSIRGEQKVKIRQPLANAVIALPPELQKKVELTNDDLNLLRQELNVKNIEFAKNPEELAEAYVQVDARKVGPRLGGRVQEIIQAGKAGEFKVEENGSILILDVTLAPDEATLVYRSKGDDAQGVAADRGVVVSIDTEITDELVQEGYARDIIRSVQRLRKENGYHFTDHIALQVEGMDEVLEKFGELISQETRSSLKKNDGEMFEVEIGEEKVKIRFAKK